MAFLTRVELHNAQSHDWTTLHSEMATRNFKRFVVADGGRRWRLPTAEYWFEGSTKEAVLSLAKQAVAATGRGATIFVAGVDGWIGSGMEEVSRSDSAASYLTR